MFSRVAGSVFIEYDDINEHRTHLVDRLPRLDSSKIHSWLPVWQRLQGGPCSAPTHFIFKRRQTVQALSEKVRNDHRGATHRLTESLS